MTCGSWYYSMTTTYQMLLASFICLCGPNTISYIITVIKLIYMKSQAIMPLARLKEDCEEQVTQMEKQTQRKMSKILISDYKNFILFSYNTDYKVFQKHSFYACLRRDTAHELNCNLFELFKNKFSIFFKGFSPHLANHLILKLQSKVYLKGECVIQADHSSPGLFFIHSGKVILQVVAKHQEKPQDTNILTKKSLNQVVTPSRRRPKGNNLSHSVISTYSKIKSSATIKEEKEAYSSDFKESVLELGEGSFFGEDFILGKKPLFDYVASDSDSSSVLKVLFVPFPVFLFLLETEFHEESNRWLLSIVFRRRMLFLVVNFQVFSLNKFGRNFRNK